MGSTFTCLGTSAPGKASCEGPALFLQGHFPSPAAEPARLPTPQSALEVDPAQPVDPWLQAPLCCAHPHPPMHTHVHMHTPTHGSLPLPLSPSHLPPHLPLAGVGGHYTYSLHRIWAVAQGRAGPWWTLLNGSQEQVGGLLTAGTEGEKGASEEGAGLLLLPSPLSAFLHRPLHHTRCLLIQEREDSSSGTRGGKPHFQTLEMMALNEGAHHPMVEFPVARKTLLNPQAFPWKAGRTSLSSEVPQPLRVLQTLWVFLKNFIKNNAFIIEKPHRLPSFFVPLSSCHILMVPKLPCI